MSMCATPLATVAASRAREQYATSGHWAIAALTGIAPTGIVNPCTHVDFAKATRRPQEASP